MGTSSVYWAQLSRFYLRTEIESSLRNVILKYKQDDILNKGETMDNVQERNGYIRRYNPADRTLQTGYQSSCNLKIQIF
jgi:hypothetical protein